MQTSPFPGMDPYLEASWGDVHQSLVIYSRDQVQSQLPSDLRARVEERVSVEAALDEPWEVYPDVRVIERPRLRVTSGIAVAEPETESLSESGVPDPLWIEPLWIEFENEAATEGYIEIVDAGSRQKVITVIEFLSQTNKRPGKDRKKFLRMRKELRRGRVSLVEIDLLRSGRRLPPMDTQPLPKDYCTPYFVLITRGGQRRWGYYRAPLHERLPKIPIPLRKSDQDAVLDLQAVLDQAYSNGRYHDLDYSIDPFPPLLPDDAAWADALLREKGLRPAHS